MSLIICQILKHFRQVRTKLRSTSFLFAIFKMGQVFSDNLDTSPLSFSSSVPTTMIKDAKMFPRQAVLLLGATKFYKDSGSVFQHFQ